MVLTRKAAKNSMMSRIISKRVVRPPKKNRNPNNWPRIN